MMHERIQALIKDATRIIPADWNCVEDLEEFDKEKFAKLIIQECLKITGSLSMLHSRKDVAFDVGYTMGCERATKEIKKHFGVE
jgi:hypothetical protein